MYYSEKMVQESSVMSTMNENEGRKWSKPVMEKRRRERINRSLEELKRLVLEAQHRDSSRYTKLEKADILEMTVKHLRSLRNRRKYMTSGQFLNQTVIPGINTGNCPCCTNKCNRCVTQNDIVNDLCQIPSSRHTVLDSNNENTMTSNFESHSRRLSSHSVIPDVVQYLPMGSNGSSGTVVPRSSRMFWRPF